MVESLPLNGQLTETLRKLALGIKKSLEQAISAGNVKPEEEPCFQWRVKQFRYTDKGVTDKGAEGHYFTKKTWFRATIELIKTTEASAQYQSAKKYLQARFGADKILRGLDSFVGKVIYGYLYNSEFNVASTESIIDALLKDLHEEPVRIGAEVELQGITLRPETITPSLGVTIRQTKIEDIEKDIPTYGPSITQHLPNPSAIMNVEFLGRQGSEIQIKVEQAIVLLRLFKVGSVKWLSYKLYSDSLVDMMAFGTLTSARPSSATENYLVTEEDIPKLKKYWQYLIDSIPGSLYKFDRSKVDHITLAYNRYSDSLLENGNIERRIANSVMGLEALLLKPNEVQELMYRFNLRLSKILSGVGYIPYDVKKAASDAYKVRNIYAHGGQLTYREKKKLDSRYGSLHKLLLRVLDYLRLMLIVMIMSNMGKEEFLDLVDDSFIDKEREKQLDSSISSIHAIIG